MRPPDFVVPEPMVPVMMVLPEPAMVRRLDPLSMLPATVKREAELFVQLCAALSLRDRLLLPRAVASAVLFSVIPPAPTVSVEAPVFVSVYPLPSVVPKTSPAIRRLR